MKQPNSSGLTCSVCDDPLVLMDGDISRTLVGYPRGECGLSHDDNCTTRVAWCQQGHRTSLSIRRVCKGCDWQGRLSCHYCHNGRKLDAWPDLPIGRPPVSIEALSAVSKALEVACPTCHATIGAPCKRPDGQAISFKGHLGVHPQRMESL
jgi:hypothetical protein